MLRSGGAVASMVVLLAGWSAAPAVAFFQTENFDAAPDGGFNNPFFNHVIVPEILFGNGPRSEFTDREVIASDFSLFLFPGTDIVTFNLGPDAFVNYVQIWLKSAVDGITFFDVIGVDGNGDPLEERLVFMPAGELGLLTTRGLGFVRITEVRLTSLKEAYFDDLTASVVPEPATGGLLLAGVAALLRAGRSRRRRRS